MNAVTKIVHLLDTNHFAIQLVKSALNYNDRDSQLSDNMSNLTIGEAAMILKMDPITLYKEVQNEANVASFVGMYLEDFQDRKDICIDWYEGEQPITRELVMTETLLWLSEDTVNAYFDYREMVTEVV